MPSKSVKGGGLTEALWAGTAVFAATKAKTYSGFLVSVAIYSVILMVILALGAWLLRTLGIHVQERFSVAQIRCQAGETPTNDCYGEEGCTKPSGACYKLLSTQTGAPASA
jgi:hypothetical protein